MPCLSLVKQVFTHSVSQDDSRGSPSARVPPKHLLIKVIPVEYAILKKYEQLMSLKVLYGTTHAT